MKQLIPGLEYHINSDGTIDIKFGTILITDLAAVCHCSEGHALAMLISAAPLDKLLDACRSHAANIYPESWLYVNDFKYRPIGPWWAVTNYEYANVKGFPPHLHNMYKALVACN